MPVPGPLRKGIAASLAVGAEQRDEIEVEGRYFSFSFVPVRGAGYVNIYGRDVTERALAEQERERALAELEAKNAELERFTYTVSHELKSPAHHHPGVSRPGGTRHQRWKARSAPEDIARIRRAAQRMQQLLDELLELSRIGRVIALCRTFRWRNLPGRLSR